MVTVVPGPGNGIPGTGKSNIGVQQLYVPSTFAWKEINSVYVNIAGTWRAVVSGYGNVNGTWRLLDLGAPSYTFNFGNSMNAGSNGYISFDNPNSVISIASTVGRVLGVLPADLYVNSFKYVGSFSYYIVRFSGRRYSSATTNEIQYEVWFPVGSSFCYVWLQAFPSGTYDSTGFYKTGKVYGRVTTSRTAGTVYKVNFSNSSATVYTSGSSWGLGAAWPGWLDATSNFTSPDDGYAPLNTNGLSNPSSVLNLTVSSVGATGTTVSWTTPTDPGQSAVTNYDWALSSDNGVTYGTSTYISSATSTTTITLGTLTSGTNYKVRVRAYNYYGNVGPWSESSTFSFTAPGLFNFYTYDSSTVPTAPLVTMTQGADTAQVYGGYMLLSWVDSIPSDTTYYNVKFWGPGSGVPTSSEASPSGSDTNWTYINNTDGGYGGVATYDDFFSGGSASGYTYSRVTAVKTGDRRVTATWTSSSNAKSYRVEFTLTNSPANGSYIGYVYGPSPATSYEIRLGSSGTVTVNQVKAYNTTDCTGIFTYGSITLFQTNSTTPTDKSTLSNLGIGYYTKRYYASVTVNASSGTNSSGGTINWSSTYQTAYTIAGDINVGYTTSTTQSRAISGLAGSTTYYFTVTVYSSDGHSASSPGTLTTAAAFTTPSFSPNPPGISWSSTQTSGSAGQSWTWGSVTASGSTSGGLTYDWQISSSSSGSPLLSSSSTSQTFLNTGATALRWARVRAKINGTNGTTYYGSWTGWT